MNKSKGFKGLEAWEVSMLLVEEIYRATANWPAYEQYGLTNQLRRAAVSIPSNIAEGHGRKSAGDFARFVDIAYGSLSEVETQVLIAQRIGYLSETSLEPLIVRVNEVGRVIQGLGRYLRRP